MHKLEIKDITKTIKKTQILNGVSLEVKSGEIVGLLGPNGAGKTTTFYTVCGLVKPTSGTVYFDDKDITEYPLHKRALKGIGYLPQESSIFKDLSVEDNLMLAAEIITEDKDEQQKRVEELLELFNIPASVLPTIISSDRYIANTASGLLGAEIPIAGILGDQQSALFGQSCFEAGTAKNTYGTGCFMLFNTGDQIQYSQNQLLTTLAWQCHQQNTFALEGSVFMAGAIVQWLRDGLGIIQHSSEVEKLACQVQDSDGVVLVPAFTGLGAPHWDSNARALLCGMSRGTSKAHIARAALESIAFQVSDVLSAMQADISQPLKELRVDGGASQNDMLMQFQADMLNVPVLRPKMLESTAWGAAAMAGLKMGIFSNVSEVAASWQLDRMFEPKMSEDQRQQHLHQWRTALKRAKSEI